MLRIGTQIKPVNPKKQTRQQHVKHYKNVRTHDLRLADPSTTEDSSQRALIGSPLIRPHHNEQGFQCVGDIADLIWQGRLLTLDRTVWLGHGAQIDIIAYLRKCIV